MYLGLVAYTCNSSTQEDCKFKAGMSCMKSAKLIWNTQRDPPLVTFSIAVTKSLKKQLWKEGLFWFTVCRCSPLWKGSHASKNLRQLWMYCVYTKEAERWVLLFIELPVFDSARDPHHMGMMPPALVSFPRPFWNHLHRYICSCVSILNKTEFGLT